jgi:toxin ParE1/3/4
VKFRILDEAKAEAFEAAAWYDTQRPGLGNEFLDALARGIEIIGADPDRFARLETSVSTRNTRRFLLSRFPYLIIYELLPDEAVMLAVAHAARRPRYWKERH